MTQKLDKSVTISRRSMLGALGTTVGAAMTAAPSLAIGSQLLAPNESQQVFRELGSRDLCCSARGLIWADFDGGSITVILATTGRPVRLSARVPLDREQPA